MRGRLKDRLFWDKQSVNLAPLAGIINWMSGRWREGVVSTLVQQLENEPNLDSIRG
jgi:hypothetical protein